MDWKPIEMAPKDGTPVLLLEPDGICVGLWARGDEWVVAQGRFALSDDDGRVYWVGTPTHWMPLPLPPIETRSDETLQAAQPEG